MTPRDEPRWLTRSALLAIHDALVREHGGLEGARDLGLVDSALSRPKNLLALGETSDLFDLAACYVVAIAQGHPFRDGNKRTGFLAAYTFLKDNGFALRVPQTDVVRILVLVAEKKIDSAELASWMRSSAVPVGRAADEP